MEQIELVIRIPKDTYVILKNVSERGTGWIDKYQKAIVNGIPLPKGHGRLIDADALIRESALLCDGFDWSDLMVSAYSIEHASTIIEADKEGEEE